MSEPDGVIVVNGIEIPFKILTFKISSSPETDAMIKAERDRLAGVIE